ncbi:MAG: response regulator [Vulcanimicrobiota bacterium]
MTGPPAPLPECPVVPGTSWSDPPLISILLLEDDQVLGPVLTDLLEDEGYQVHWAQSAILALSLVEAETFDLMIFDIRMEGMDGLEALARIQQRGETFPTLAMTGFASDHDPIRALRLGVGDYLRKPFPPEQLLGSVTRLLQRHRDQKRSEAQMAALTELSRWCNRALGSHLAASALAERVSQLAGAIPLDPAVVAQLALASLVLSLRPEALSQSQPPEPLSSWLQALEERYDGHGPQALRGVEVPLEAQVLALGQAWLDSEQSADQLAQSQAGRFHPMLLGVLRQLQHPDQPARVDWLVQARCLLAGGRLEQARMLVEAAWRDCPEGRAGVDACLVLAELNQAQPAQTLAWVNRAVELARELGPTVVASTMRWAALLLHRLKLPEAESALLQAHQRLVELGRFPESYLLEFALGRFEASKLERLLQPEHEPLLAPELGGLFPILQRLAPERLVRRLVARYPSLVPQEARGPEPGDESLRVVALGGLEMYWGGQPIAEELWRGPLVRYLFAYFCLHSKPVLEAEVLEAFWPEGEETSRRKLSGALSTLRATLQKAMVRKLDPLIRQRDRFYLNPELHLWHDVHEFERACQAARQSDSLEVRLAEWNRLQVLYQGPYLNGCYMDWALVQRQRQEQALLEVSQQIARTAWETHLEVGLEAAQRAVQLDPWNQPTQALLMRIWMRLGQPERAIRHYQKLVPQLHQELGAEPSIELIECYQRARLALD